VSCCCCCCCCYFSEALIIGTRGVHEIHNLLALLLCSHLLQLFIHPPIDERESLKFKLLGSADYDTLLSMGDTASAADNNLGSWGHEFVRSLAGEIGQEYNARILSGADPDEDGPFHDLLKMVDVIVPFNVAHNAEAEAIDLLIEVQRLKKILELENIDEKNYRRVCLYLIKTADFMSDPDDYAVSFNCWLREFTVAETYC